MSSKERRIRSGTRSAGQIHRVTIIYLKYDVAERLFKILTNTIRSSPEVKNEQLGLGKVCMYVSYAFVCMYASVENQFWLFPKAATLNEVTAISDINEPIPPKNLIEFVPVESLSVEPTQNSTGEVSNKKRPFLIRSIVLDSCVENRGYANAGSQ